MAPKTNGALPKMDDVFKSHPHPEVLQDHLADYRQRAIEILQTTMPQKIQLVRALIASEDDPSSIWSKEQVFRVEFTDINLTQPVRVDGGANLHGNGSRKDGEDGKKGFVLPSDIFADGAISTLDGPDGQPQGHAVRLGMHWFEVLRLNEVQMKCMEAITTELEDLHIICQDLKVWLELEIPLIEDGNSFGADVQAQMIRELTEAYKKSNAMSNGSRAHHGDRLKLALDWAKYPNFSDFKAAIEASDRFDHMILRSYLRSLLIVYGGILTKFERNWTKIINPKGSGGGGGMY